MSNPDTNKYLSIIDNYDIPFHHNPCIQLKIQIIIDAQRKFL